MRTNVYSSICLVAAVACSNNHEQPHPRPASPTHHQLEHASQSDLARELDDADRRGTWGDVRHRWQGQELEWTVTRHRVLCGSEAECHVAAFPVAHGAQRGWLPAVAFAPGEYGKLDALCGKDEACDVVIAGTLAKLDATGDMPTAVKLANVRVVRRS